MKNNVDMDRYYPAITKLLTLVICFTSKKKIIVNYEQNPSCR